MLLITVENLKNPCKMMMLTNIRKFHKSPRSSMPRHNQDAFALWLSPPGPWAPLFPKLHEQDDASGHRPRCLEVALTLAQKKNRFQPAPPIHTGRQCPSTGEVL